MGPSDTFVALGPGYRRGLELDLRHFHVLRYRDVAFLHRLSGTGYDGFSHIVGFYWTGAC